MTLPRGIGLSICLALGPAALAQTPLTIGPSSLPNGAPGQFYFAQLTSGGTSVTQWSIISGGLPPGVTLNPQTGSSVSISGTPSAGGTYTFTVKALDPPNGQSGSKQYSIGILQITTPSPLPSGMELTSYSQPFTASDGTPPYIFSIVTNSTTPNSFTPASSGAGAVPPGLSLSPNGSFSGFPTNNSAGTYDFTVGVLDATGIQTTAPFTITIVTQLVITTFSPLPPGTVGTTYSQTINASGGMPPYRYSITPAPAGLSIGATGVLSGTPTATGTVNFAVKVVDSLQFAATKQFQITFSAAGPVLQVSPLQLSFSAVAGADAPPPQAIKIVPTGQTPVPFSVQVDGGAPNTQPPAWLTVKPVSGTAPGTLVVSVDQTGLAGGGPALAAGIQISAPNTGAAAVSVTVSLSVTAATQPHLQIAPGFLRFAESAQSPATLEQVVAVGNTGGGGTLSFTTSVVGRSSWITGVTPSVGQTAPNTPLLLRIGVNTQGLGPGSYHDLIRITSSAGSSDVPVSVSVSKQGPVLGLDVVGLRFLVRQGNGTSMSKTVKVLNLGDAGSTVNWTADLLSGSDWLTLSSSRGTSTPANPGSLVLSPNAKAASFPAGGRYALVRVSDPQTPNSPRYLVVVLDVEPATALPEPDPSPAGLFFIAATSAPAAQSVSVYTSSLAPVAFQAAPVTADGANWLTVNVTTPTASTQTPGAVGVSVNPASLKPGIYTGGVNIAMGSVLRTVNVTLVVVSTLPLTTQSVSPQHGQASGGCAPSRLALTQSGLVGNFAVPAGWPAALIVKLNDDCGNPVTNGAAVASFSNGDPPLSLSGDHQTGTYSATWQPGIVVPQMTITVRATSPQLQTVTAQWIGTVDQNAATPPTLVPNGALHIFFNSATAALLGGGLAPGNVAQVYGTGLAAVSGSTGAVPLVTEFKGTFLLVGGFQAPLFYVSDQLVDIQIPFELAGSGQYAMIASSNGALTLPETVDIVTLQPGMAAFADGSVIAQHGVDYSLVTAASPAKPGESLIVYLAGMGATNPSVKSGDPTPLALIAATVQPTVTLDGQNASIAYAGLTPTGIGLYQVNFSVPSNARPGSLDLVVLQGGVSSNTTKLPVGTP